MCSKKVLGVFFFFLSNLQKKRVMLKIRKKEGDWLKAEAAGMNLPAPAVVHGGVLLLSDASIIC